MLMDDLDVKYMKDAFKLAHHGLYTTLPNPCVGCLIVKDGNVIGSGYHVKAGTPHAEIVAINNAHGRDLTGSIVYVTLEPCSHYGLTPPCAKALVDAKVKRVVCGTLDPNPLVSGNGVKILQEAGIEVKVLDFQKEQELLNKTFLYAMKNERPYVTVKFGMSIDGKIALKNGESKWITSEESRSDVQRLRVLNQAILTSATTVLADNPKFNIRYDELPRDVVLDYSRDMLKNPVKVVVDTRNKLTGKEQIFSTGAQVWVIRLSSDSHVHEEKFLDNENATLIKIPPYKVTGKLDFEILLAELQYRKIRSVLVEAGGRFVNSLLNQDVVNELIVYVAPKILGSDGISAFVKEGEVSLANVNNYILSDVSKIGNDVRLTYLVP